MKPFIHPTAIVETKDIGEGSRIWHFVHIRKGAKIGKECNIGKSVYIDEGVVIGNRVKIQNFVSVYKGVEIGDDVFVGPSVTFTNDKHPRAYIWDESRICKTRVERGASIGANATIVCGVTIGEYAMVGAGAVVTKNVPKHAIVVGNPAKIVGFACYCGEKMEKVREEGEKVVLKCPKCGKEVVLDGSLYSKAIHK